MERSTVNAKLVMLGETAVGKSCLVMRFCKGEFPDWQDPTIGAAFMTHVVRLTGEDGETVDGGAPRPDGAPDAVKFEIWDTAGQERYRSLAPMYYRGAAAACVVYDITNRESFDGAQSWIQELQGVNSTSNVVMALVGSKKDLAVRSREVPEEDAEAYAAENGLFFMETSAKTGENVQELFREVAVRLPALARPDAGVTRLDGAAGASNAAGGCCGG